MSDNIDIIKNLVYTLEVTNDKLLHINNDMVKHNTLLNITEKRLHESLTCINNLMDTIQELRNDNKILEEKNKLVESKIIDLDKELNFFKDFNYIEKADN